VTPLRRGYLFGLFGLGAYALWGFFPLYWKLLRPANPVEILAHRIVWSVVFVALVLLAVRRWRLVAGLARRPRTLAGIALAAMLVAANWGTYIYGVNSDHVVETSLGYFINPLVTVLLGVGVESAVLAGPALACLGVLAAQGRSTFGHVSARHTALLVLAGAVTAVPLLLFAGAANRIPLSALGLPGAPPSRRSPPRLHDTCMTAGACLTDRVQTGSYASSGTPSPRRSSIRAMSIGACRVIWSSQKSSPYSAVQVPTCSGSPPARGTTYSRKVHRWWSAGSTSYTQWILIFVPWSVEISAISALTGVGPSVTGCIANIGVVSMGRASNTASVPMLTTTATNAATSPAPSVRHRSRRRWSACRFWAAHRTVGSKVSGAFGGAATDPVAPISPMAASSSRPSNPGRTASSATSSRQLSQLARCRS
jgi:chloramphenicol-sensitive protein RarD